MVEFFTFDLDSETPAAASQPPQAVATNRLIATARQASNPLPRMEKSRRSQMSLVAKFMAMDPVAHELFEERAAILEYDAGLPRVEAERQAFAQIMDRYRTS